LEIEKSKMRDLEGKSIYFQDILEKIPSWIVRFGNLGIFLIFSILLIGLGFVEYPKVIEADMVISSNNPPISVHSRSEGRISAFLKNDQEYVKQGDWIIELNNSANTKEVRKVYQFIDSLKGKESLESFLKIKLPWYSNLGVLQNSYSKFKRSIQELKQFLKLDPQIRRISLNDGRMEDLLILKEKIRMQRDLLQKEVELVAKELDRFEKLNKNGFVSDSEYEKKEIAFYKIKGQLEAVKEKLLNKNLEINDVTKETTDLNYTKNETYFALRTDIFENYNDLLVNITEWEQMYIINAPIDGKLNLYEVRNNQQYITDNQEVFTLIPGGDEEQFALAKFPASNSGQIQKGQECIIKLDNYSFQEFGMLRGQVQSLTAVPKEGYYTVKIDLPENLVTTTGYQIDNAQEFSGKAEIILGDYSALERLFYFINKQTN
jgi:HlyD family secretion protein